MELLSSVFEKNNLLVAFVVVGALMLLSGWLSRTLTRGRLHGSAVAIILGLALAYWGGVVTGGEDGLADIAIFSGLGLMGGAMLRDLAIVSTAYGVDLKEIRRSGAAGALSIVLGVVFVVGNMVILLPGAWGDWAAKLMPGNAGSSVAMPRPLNPELLDAWTGFAVFSAQAAVVLVLGYLVFQRRDA